MEFVYNEEDPKSGTDGEQQQVPPDTKPRMFLCSVTTAESSATSGQIASILLLACGVGATICTRKEPFLNTDMLQLPDC
jgi:hypothetical protein